MTAPLRVSLPLRIVSTANLRENWRGGRRRTRAQRDTAYWTVLAQVRPLLKAAGWRVTLTRVGKRTLDSDNLAISFKAVRDGVARALGVDDGDARIKFRYEQRKGETYGAEVLIEPVE